MKRQVAVTALVLALGSHICLSASDDSALEKHFMDCGENYVLWSFTRRCCKDNRLPRECECFDISSDTDFSNTLFHKPCCPSDIDATFSLFTPQFKTKGKIITAGEDGVRDKGFDPYLPTVFITHGFTDSVGAGWILRIKDALLEEGDKNVIAVDWEHGAKGPNYFQAAANTRTVAAMVARIITDLNRYFKVSPDTVHVVGHSLGAQIAGYTGKEIYRLTGQKLGRITGLDPAGPLFESYSSYVTIDKSDAKFVDIIHTDATMLMDGGLGTRNATGHCDFFPNGGHDQPGCGFSVTSLLLMGYIQEEKEKLFCNHYRSVYLFLTSINQCRWDSPTSGSECTMGYHVSNTCRGSHFPDTTSVPPFC